MQALSSHRVNFSIAFSWHARGLSNDARSFVGFAAACCDRGTSIPSRCRRRNKDSVRDLPDASNLLPRHELSFLERPCCHNLHIRWPLSALRFVCQFFAPRDINRDIKQVDTSNPDEGEAIKDLKASADEALESDLLDSATDSGLSQVVSIVAPFMRLVVGEGFCLQAAYVASRASLSLSPSVCACCLCSFFGKASGCFSSSMLAVARVTLVQIVQLGGFRSRLRCRIAWVCVYFTVVAFVAEAGSQCQPPEDPPILSMMAVFVMPLPAALSSPLVLKLVLFLLATCSSACSQLFAPLLFV